MKIRFLPFIGALLIACAFTLGLTGSTAVSRLVGAAEAAENGPSSGADSEWKSDELNLLGVGMAIGDVEGNGAKNIILIDPSTVYVYRLAQNVMSLVTEYSTSSLELKSVDTFRPTKNGPDRIYLSAQNRGAVASLVLELRKNTLVPVIENSPYFLRVIEYPTRGKYLLGQQRGMRRMYDGPVYQMQDTGSSLQVGPRFGIPLKIPVFGFTIGDFAGNRTPLIAAFDRSDHIRIYTPQGKKLFVTQEFYGGADSVLRWRGPEVRESESRKLNDEEVEFFRPRLIALDDYRRGIHQLLTFYHSSKTRRLLSQTKMLEEGQIMGLKWNGDALVELWSTPKLQGMITDFAVDASDPSGRRKLVVLERKKTDWLAFLRSKSQVRIYDLDTYLKGQ